MSFTDLMQNHIVQGAINGVMAAAVIDLQAFRNWKSFNDAAEYQWGTAAFRWFQGAVVGALTAAGLGAAFGS
jgi:hypothetical protein